MQDYQQFSTLFKRSSFFIIKKSDELSLEFTNQFSFENKINKYHPDRKKEFMLGRFCAFKCYEKEMGETLLNLNSHEDRSPLWPKAVIGSISHNKDFVCAAVGKKASLEGLGIDLEEMGRVKKELRSQICTNQDLKDHPDFSEEELLTLIFSAKEALYKALYPSVNKFFGFEAAYVSSIDLKTETFNIHLLTDLNLKYGPSAQSEFCGRFKIINNLCLSVLEII